MDTFTVNMNIQSFSLLVLCGLVSSATLPMSGTLGHNRYSNDPIWNSLDNTYETIRENAKVDGPPIELQARSGDNYKAIMNILKDPDGKARNVVRQTDNGFFKREEETNSMDAFIPDSLANDLYELDRDLETEPNADHTEDGLGFQTSRETARFAEKRSGAGQKYASMTIGKRFYDKRSYDLYTRYLKQLMRFLTLRRERQQRAGNDGGHKRRASAIRQYDTLDLLGSGLIGR